MSMVLLPCHRCWVETFDQKHTREECDAQVEENRLAGIEHEKRNEEWRAHIAKLKVEGKPLPPTIKLPPGRIVKPTLLKVGEVTLDPMAPISWEEDDG